MLLEHHLITCDNFLRKLGKALREKVKLPAARVSEVVDFVASEASVVIKGSDPVGAPVDVDDARILGEAKHGSSDLFATGDAAVLKLGRVDQLQIVSPRQFWEVLHTR